MLVSPQPLLHPGTSHVQLQHARYNKWHPSCMCMQDSIWMPNRPVVGRKAFSTFVQQMRQAYPDFYYEIGQVCSLAKHDESPTFWDLVL